jgi:hypothetical protein
MQISTSWFPAIAPQPAARRRSVSQDTVELSSVAWSSADRKALKKRLSKLETLSLEDKDSFKQAWKLAERQEDLGKSPKEVGDWLERIAVSASSKKLLSFYYERFWEDLEPKRLDDDERRDHYLGMLENLFGDPAERSARWDLIDRSECGQPWAERARALGSLLEGVSLKGLSRIEDCQRAFRCWETAVKSGCDPAVSRGIVATIGDDLVGGNWADKAGLEEDFTRLEQALSRLGKCPSEVQDGVLRCGVGFETLCTFMEHPLTEPAARLLPCVADHSDQDAEGWLATFQALADAGLDPVAASFVVQEHLRKNEGAPAPKDPVEAARQLKAKLPDALGLPAAPPAGVQLGPDAVTVGSVRVPVRRPA